MINLEGFDQPEMTEVEHDAVLESIQKYASDYLTICEQIRFIYDAVFLIQDRELKKEITERLVVAFLMGKKMNSRLAYYKKTYNKDFSGSKGSNLLKLKGTKTREAQRKMRVYL